MNVVDWIKEHPYASAGIVCAVLVLVLLLTRSGGTTQVASSGVSDAQVQAETAYAIAQQQAQTQQYAVNQAASLQLAALSASEAIAKLHAENASEKTQLSASVTTALASIQAEVQKASIATSASIAASNNDLSATIARLQSNTAVNASNNATLVETTLINQLAPGNNTSQSTTFSQQIAQVYNNLLGRAPEEGAVEAWKSTGMSIAQIQQAAQQSEEYAVVQAERTTGVSLSRADVTALAQEFKTGQITADQLAQKVQFMGAAR